MRNNFLNFSSRVTAVLGPTNTGKTHYAIERMLGHRTGIIGLPLRLLAREVYDKIVLLQGSANVALLTGEERIVPATTQYWVCTVEAMPQKLEVDFIAVDEIQLCADPERGHVFTERLLSSRGSSETLFLGSDAMRKSIQSLVPEAVFQSRERLSHLVYTGECKISRMPSRSAIVSFSVDSVYSMAELIRRQKGGAAVVMGALSPRTRNAQVELYQNGEVDFLVATDAIGMGLNLDINHVAFAGISKFDGRKLRMLAPNELAQISGRAGRGMSDGTFGVTGEVSSLASNVSQAIMDHKFTPIRKLNWRNSELVFESVNDLIHSLESAPTREELIKAHEADDLIALKALTSHREILDRASERNSIKLLWNVCQIPDFRGISQSEHANLLQSIFKFIHDNGHVPQDWIARQIKLIDHISGDLDTLSMRLAYIRTWTYVAQRNNWVENEQYWREQTRAVEYRISDALHEKLTQRFVDRRTSVLLRNLKQKEVLLTKVSDQGEVIIEDQFVGRLEGFRFIQDKGQSDTEAKAIKSASMQALAPHFVLQAERFCHSSDKDISLSEQGDFIWGESVVGKLQRGQTPLKPKVTAIVDEATGQQILSKVEQRLQQYFDRKLATLFEPLFAMQNDETLAPLPRGFAFRLIEHFGIIPRSSIVDEVKELDQEARGSLRKHGLRFGQFTIFVPNLLKPAPTQLRIALWSLLQPIEQFPSVPTPGRVTILNDQKKPDGYFEMAGYYCIGERALRIDILERLADLLRVEDHRKGFEASADMLSITGLTLAQFANVMQGLGYQVKSGERPKIKQNEPEDSSDNAAGAGQETLLQATKLNHHHKDMDAVASDQTTVASAGAVDKEHSEIEPFYVFSFNKKRGQRYRSSDLKSNNAKKKRRKFKVNKKSGQCTERHFVRPVAKEKAIDSNNPFAQALRGFKDQI